jgi:DNA-directed RNA polymerase specialized sigma24 family protein
MEGAMERELVLAARLGDEVAFARLIESEAPRAYRAVLAVVRSPEDAQEVMQDATMRAWRQLRGLRDAASWPAWFRRIAVRFDGRDQGPGMGCDSPSAGVTTTAP